MASKPLTEDDYDLLFTAKNEFYESFSKLVNYTLKKVHPRLRSELEAQLSETANVYSRNTKL